MVGLDGDGLQDLVPPGTQYVTIWSQVFQITLHSAWTEYLQDQQTEQVIAGLRVSGGDIISVDVEMLPDGSTASFVVYNETTNTYTTVQTASATRPGRTEADWIVERPTPNVGTPNQQFAELGDYGSIEIIHPHAGLNALDVNYLGEGDGAPGLATVTSLDIAMVSDGGTTFSTVAADGDDAMTFTWHASD